MNDEAPCPTCHHEVSLLGVVEDAVRELRVDLGPTQEELHPEDFDHGTIREFSGTIYYVSA